MLRLCSWNSKNPEVQRLRRKTAPLAGSCAAMAGITALTALHHHPFAHGFCIGLQIVLLCRALHFLAKAKRLEASEKL
jgi:hypothetical protein